jgi:GxxExxY protein
MEINSVTGAVIDVGLRIHKRLGPGLLESVYRKVLAHELRKRGFEVVEELPLPVVWDSVKLDLGFRLDLLVNRELIVEVKSQEGILPVHKKQLLTHLRLTDNHVGLLLNFNVELFKDGITRVVNNLQN